MKINNSFKFLNSVVAGAALTLVAGHSFAVTPVGSGAAIQGTGGLTGLLGTYWQEAAGSTGQNVVQVKNQMAMTTSTGTFVSSNVNYSASDTSSIQTFLGADNSSYMGSAGNMGDGILELKGFIKISSPTLLFTFQHDDIAELTVGNVVLISSGTPATDAVTASFATNGFYAVDIIYANTAAADANHAAVFKLNQNNMNYFYQTVSAVPEPETYALLLAGLGVLGMVARRRKPQ